MRRNPTVADISKRIREIGSEQVRLRRLRRELETREDALISEQVILQDARSVLRGKSGRRVLLMKRLREEDVERVCRLEMDLGEVRDHEAFENACREWEQAREVISFLRRRGFNYASVDAFATLLAIRGPRQILTHRNPNLPDWSPRDRVEDAEDVLAEVCSAVGLTPDLDKDPEAALAELAFPGLRQKPRQCDYRTAPSWAVEAVEEDRQELLALVRGETPTRSSM